MSQINYRSLSAQDVWLTDVTLTTTQVEIGVALVRNPVGSVDLLDRDSRQYVTLDLSSLAVGTSYKVVLNR